MLEAAYPNPLLRPGACSAYNAGGAAVSTSWLSIRSRQVTLLNFSITRGGLEDQVCWGHVRHYGGFKTSSPCS